MPLRTLQCLVLLGPLLLSASCQSRHATAKEPTTVCPPVDESAAQALAVVVVDGKRLAEPVRQDLSNMIESLPSGTGLFAVVVAEHASPGMALLHDIMPPAPPQGFVCVVQNPFDLQERKECKRQKQHYQDQQACLHTARQQMIAKLAGLDSLRATHSNLWDAMVTAGEIFAAYTTASMRWLIVYADLANVCTTPPPALPPGLAGVRVIARGAPTAFTHLLARHGADLSITPVAVPWPPVLFRRADARPGIIVDPPEVWPTDLDAFMKALMPAGPFGVIVSSHSSERAARNEVQYIAHRFPPLRPSSWRSKDGWWAVRLGDAYDRASAQALKEKARQLGLRADSFVFEDLCR